MKTVLLLDDARSIRSVYAEVIRQAGFEAQTVASAEEGLQYMVDHGIPDLIVTDIDMPGISGLEFCSRVRQVAKHTPIIVMSTLAGKSLVTEAKLLGVQGWMLKPVQPEYFLNKLKSVLDETHALSS
ncbi:Response regulator [Limnobacter sp. 130]|uniref:response regulator n=1 Tax=Limnobacter sp. 130 TaxID=2653147 RepID=UPI0012EFE755|nr:response regulator [Limnobacter sp. 130]VWX32786.1 Response regulator [Limnobacter sp. 130]